jgi:hypothetical protein
MKDADIAAVDGLLKMAGFAYSAREFKRVSSARTLYHWNADAQQEY